MFSHSLSISSLSLLTQSSTIETGLLADHPPQISAKIIFQPCCSSSLKPNNLNYPLSLFNHSTENSSFLYNTLIRSHTQNHHPEQALSLFYQMLSYSPPDNFTFPPVLKACAQLFALEEGQQLHSMILKTQSLTHDLFVCNSLIHMYGRCGQIDKARKVFDTMDHRNVVSWNSMIDGFARSGDIDTALWFFDEMPEKNIVSWNSMIAGYERNSLPHEALGLFLEFQRLRLRPDESTLVAVLSAISDLGFLNSGKQVHGHVTRHIFSLTGILGVALIDMYSKCGSIFTAFQVFKAIPNKNVAHWTSMIVGFAKHGYADASLQLFSQMQVFGVKPNYVTFIGVLSACSHAGLLEQGLKHFILMRKDYNIYPGIEHYGCLVDLLGRLGLLEEAKAVIQTMPMEPGVVIWSTLLATCRTHGNIEVAEFAAHKLLENEPNYGGCYVLLSDLYARFDRSEDFSRIRKMMEERGLEKAPGFSWIEVGGRVHQFVAGDKFHPRSRDIYQVLNEIEWLSRGAGYESGGEGG